MSFLRLKTNMFSKYQFKKRALAFDYTHAYDRFLRQTDVTNDDILLDQSNLDNIFIHH